MTKLKHLLSPIKIGKMELKNRVEFAPVTDNFAIDDYVTDRMIKFYEDRAKGGVGLINIGYFTVNYPHNPLGIGMYDDKFIPGIKKLTAACHAHGAKVGVELAFEENYAKKRGGPFEYIGPSDVCTREGKPKPRALTTEEVEEIVEQFGEAARRAVEGGFDLIHILGSAGYPIAQFASPLTNRRTDKYGGSFEKRLRLHTEIIQAMKKKGGQDTIISWRMGGQDFMPGGNTVEDSCKIAQYLEKQGVEVINVTTGWHDSGQPFIQYFVPKANWIFMGEKIKKGLKIPVIVGTRIVDPIMADRIIAEGRADMIYLARPLIADAELIKKAEEGRLDDIVPCTSCCLCFDAWSRTEPIYCQVNARAGRELELNITPAKKPRKVFIIGGGPGGMEAARVARLRGHDVTLFEKSDKLGGALFAAGAPSVKDGIGYFREYLEKQMKKLGVKVKTKTEADNALIEKERPDEVVVATGAVPIIPHIPGVKGKNVVLAVDVLTGKKKVGDKIIILGGGMVGCEVADYLYEEKGKRDITILEILSKVAIDVGPTLRWVVRKRLNDFKIKIRTGTTATAITQQGVSIVCGGSKELLEADTVVIAVGYEPTSKLAREIEGKTGVSVSVVGDCDKVARIAEAVESGFRTGLKI
ncbi:MAG TPA: FAD-dependent oxidoreductase [Syntrophales bacterium]|nr:FAD-dependent oxidoreductase [Syntrophales bacterium]